MVSLTWWEFFFCNRACKISFAILQGNAFFNSAILETGLPLGVIYKFRDELKYCIDMYMIKET